MTIALLLIMLVMTVLSLGATTKPTNKVDLENWEDLFKLACDVYYTLGSIPTSEIPTDQVEFNALLTGQTQKFQPLGTHLDDPMDLTIEQQFDEDASGWKGGWKPSGTTKGIAFCADMITLLDSAEFKGFISLLFVPKAMPEVFSATAPGLYFAISGIKLIPAVKPNVGGNKSAIDFKIYGPAKGNLTDYVKLAWITDDGVA